jgi:hypothetical protein
MPRLLRGVARTAVIAGTATAVSGRVQRRQAERFASRDANIYAQRDQAYQEQTAHDQLPPPPLPQAPQEDIYTQLQKLGDLKASGILTEEEFQTQKARILGR